MLPTFIWFNIATQIDEYDIIIQNKFGFVYKTS